MCSRQSPGARAQLPVAPGTGDVRQYTPLAGQANTFVYESQTAGRL